jgi:hypothetical protein
MDRTLLTIIQRIILNETVWLRHYIGKVLAFAQDNSGMVQVAVFDLGCDTGDKAFWCYPRDKMGILTPALGDWVEIYFIGGDRNRPVYMGIAAEIADQLPKNYDGKNTTQVLFEDGDNKFHIKYDAAGNAFEIGNSNMLAAARETDPTLSNSSTDSAFWTWLSAVFTAFSTFVTGLNAGTLTAQALAMSLALAANPTPTSQTGKINGGSDQTSIGDK